MFKTGQNVYLLIHSGSRAAKAIKDRTDPNQWVIVGSITRITRSNVVVNQDIYFNKQEGGVLHNNEFSLYINSDLAYVEARRKIVVGRLNSIMQGATWANNYTVEELEHVLFTLEHGVAPQQAGGKPASISEFFK